MDVSFVLGAVACNDKSYKPTNESRVGSCEKCTSLVWLSDKLLEVKRANPNYKVWCSKCINVESAKPETSVSFIDLNKSSSGDADSTDKLLEGFKEVLLTKAKEDHGRQHEVLRKSLPSLLSCSMARLKIWSCVEDLMIAMMIANFVETLLFENHRHHDNPFHGWKESDCLIILKYLFSVSKASHECGQHIDDLNESDHAEEWTKGFAHWQEGFANGGNWSAPKPPGGDM